MHVLGDLLHSTSIVIASILLYIWPHLWFLDPACTLFFAAVVVWTTKDTLMEAIYLLMEATPKELDPKAIIKAFSEVDDVVDVHDLHTWALSENKFALTVHIKCQPNRSKSVLNAIDSISRHKFHINHVTIQIEEMDHPYFCSNDLHQN